MKHLQATFPISRRGRRRLGGTRGGVTWNIYKPHSQYPGSLRQEGTRGGATWNIYKPHSQYRGSVRQEGTRGGATWNIYKPHSQYRGGGSVRWGGTWGGATWNIYKPHSQYRGGGDGEEAREEGRRETSTSHIPNIAAAATTARRHERRGDVKHLQATFPISRRRGRRRLGGTRGGATWNIYKPHSQYRGSVRQEGTRGGATWNIYKPHSQYRGGGDGEEAQEEGRRETSTSHIPNIAARTTTARRHERRGDVKHLQATFPISRRGRRRLGGTRGGATWNIYKPHSQYPGSVRQEGTRGGATWNIYKPHSQYRGSVRQEGTRGGATWNIYKPHSQYRGGGSVRWGGTWGGATWNIYKPHSQYRGGGDGEEAREEGRRETSTSHIPNIAAAATTARRHERRGDVKHLQATFPISRRRGRRRLGGTRGGATWNIYKPHSQYRGSVRQEGTRGGATWNIYKPHSQYRGGGDGEEAQEEGRRETSTSHIPNIAAGATTARRHERRGDVKHLQATFPISRRGRQRLGGTRGGATWNIYKPHSQYRGSVRQEGTRGGATWNIYKPHSQYRGGGDGEEAQEEGRRETSTSHIPNIAAGATTARRHVRRGDVKHLQATFPISRRERQRLGGTWGGATWNIYKPHSQYRGGGDDG